MFASLYVPQFFLQAASRHDDHTAAQPAAILDQGTKPVVLELNAAAHQSGVAPGLTASQAMARCSNLLLKARSPLQEKAATEILLQTAYAFSARLEATSPGLCTMELTGLGLSTTPSRREWGEKLLARLTPFGLQARLGLAATPSLAALAARAARPLLLAEDTAQFVASLDMAALSISPVLAELLQGWGIRTMGEFLALPQESVTERLGPEAVELYQRVSPHCSRPLKLISPPENFSEQMEFEREIETAAPLLFILRRFVEQLSRRLEAVYLVVAEFQLDLGLATGAHHQRTLQIPSPTGKIDVLFRTLQTHLETLQTEAPIVSLRLTVKPAQPEGQQFGLFETTVRNPHQFAETLARLGALCGQENVGTPVLESTYRPDSFHLQKPEFAPRFFAPAPVAATSLALRRFRPVLKASVEFREERPVLLHSAVFRGPVAKTRGPFYSSGQWWEDTRWAREEWDVETGDGTLLRIFRSNTGCFVEGVYD